MFKLRNLYILCTKLANFKCDACYRSQNSWDGRTFTMVQHLLFFSEQFEDVWASRLWVLVLEFGPILAWYKFPAVEEFVVVWRIFLCNDAPNVLYRWKIWTAGRPIQHPDFSTTKPCRCNSCRVQFCIVLLKYMLSGSLYTFQHSYCLRKHANCPYRMHLCSPIFILPQIISLETKCEHS